MSILDLHHLRGGHGLQLAHCRPGRALLVSGASQQPALPIKGALFAITEPYLRLFRRFLPTARIGSFGLDLSALVGLVILFIVIQALARI